MAAVMNEVRKARSGIPAEVITMLTMWGDYKQRPSRSTDAGPDGYPKESPFVKAARYGQLGIPQETNVRVVSDPDPPYVQEIDRILAAMPLDLAEVISMQYCPPLTAFGNGPAFEMKAKLLNLSASTFRNRLESAQWFVFARMYPA
jgi:hypothetical protein